MIPAIGNIGDAGHGLNASHTFSKRQGTIKNLFQGVRKELDQLYVKLNGDNGVDDINYGADTGLTTPHVPQFTLK